MKLTNQFDVPLEPQDAWRLVMDIPRIVNCVPGAELVSVVDERTYKGKVSVKLGPVALAFLGNVNFVEIDEENLKAVVKAQGADQKGRGGANAMVDFSLAPVEGGTTVTVETDLNLSGTVAQYGRASGMIESVATEMTKAFAANLRKQIAESGVDGDVDGGPAKPISGISLMSKAFVRRIGLVSDEK